MKESTPTTTIIVDPDDDDDVPALLLRLRDAGADTNTTTITIPTGPEVRAGYDRVRGLALRCAALERSMLVAPDPAAVRTYEEEWDASMVDLALEMHVLSHLLAYRHVTTVAMPLHAEARAHAEAGALLARRAELLARVAAARRASTTSSSTKSSEDDDSTDLKLAGVMFDDAAAALDAAGDAWPGQFDYYIVAKKKT